MPQIASVLTEEQRDRLIARVPKKLQKLSRVMCRSGPNFQAVSVPDCAFAVVMRHLEILRQFQAIRRASILAQSAEHAPRSVVGKRGQNFSPCGVISQP